MAHINFNPIFRYVFLVMLWQVGANILHWENVNQFCLH